MNEAAMSEFWRYSYRFTSDHGGSPKDCATCIDLGLTSHDGRITKEDQKTIDFDYNVRVTKETINMSRSWCFCRRRNWLFRFIRNWNWRKEDGVGAEGKLDHDPIRSK